MHPEFTIEGLLIDVEARRIYPAAVRVEAGLVTDLREIKSAPQVYLMPGFVDAHVHIESSMLVPSEFGRLAAVHGTVATVSDPHEIANVCGTDGVRFMLQNAQHSPVKIFFGAPSCVPATPFETAGAAIDAAAVEALLKRPDIWYLAEMMNYPGVLASDDEVLRKLEAARRAGKPIDGHAPGLRGAEAARYAAAGPSTDHECTTLEEALDKVAAGMKIWIREGSAARNFDALHPLLHLHPGHVAFCSDDKHPDGLVAGHINSLAARAVALRYDVFDVVRAACINAVEHYSLPVGRLRVGDPADFIVVRDPQRFEVLQTYVDGRLVADAGKPLAPSCEVWLKTDFRTHYQGAAEYPIPATEAGMYVRVIEVEDGQLTTRHVVAKGTKRSGQWIADVGKDLLKLVVINRYLDYGPQAYAFVRGFGLQQGAIASTSAHDSHNIIAVGCDDASIAAAIDAVIAEEGGISLAWDAERAEVLPLPIAGLMSGEDGYGVAARYTALDAAAKSLGTPLRAPFMTLSFLALLVIPSLKLSDQGLFDSSRFCFVPVEV